jgi:hypothetical protein
MPLVPNRFLFRVAHPCLHRAAMPLEGDDLLDLPEAYRIDNFAAMDEQRNFADFRLAWNDSGLGVQVDVRGKDKPMAGDESRPRHSDGFSLWIDTRDARTSHRASRHCHLFHFLASGGGPDKDEPAFVQRKINRALQDAPEVSAKDVPFRFHNLRGGYRLEAFLPASALNGFDPEQNPRLGFFYVVHDLELGDQTLSAATDLPYAEDPTLWSVLELVAEGKK